MKPGVSQHELQQARKLFLEGEPFDESILDETAIRRWEEDRQMGFIGRGPTLPLAAQYQESTLNSEHLHLLKLLNSVAEKSFQLEVGALTAFKIASLLLADFDGNLVIYGISGNPDVLEDLGKIGIRIGTSLSRDKVGPLAVNECIGKEGLLWSEGFENTQDALTPYAICAVHAGNDSSIIHTDFIQAFMVPMASFSEATKSIVDLLYSRTKSVLPTDILPQVSIRDHAFEELLIRREIALIITNKRGSVIDVNPYCKELLGFSYLQLGGQKLQNVIPELAGVNLRKRSVHTVTLAKPPVEVRFELEPAEIDGKYLGTAVYAVSTSKDKKNADAVVDTRAHFTFNDIVGKNPDFLRVRETALLASTTNSNVLLCGETGVGKELFAHAIHAESHRSHGPFVVVNCGGLIDSMVESTLFGNVEGVFSESGGTQAIGKIEQASGGTIFFADVDKLPLRVQPVLATVLKTGTLTRIGSPVERHVSVRIIASAGPSLEMRVKEGSFNEELYYLLDIMRIDVLPLRNRADDIPLLAKRYLAFANRSFKKNITKISGDAMAAFTRYDWPGNIAELQNTIERCVGLEQGSRITTASLPDHILLSHARIANGSLRSFEDFELRRIKELMVKYNGNKSKVAEELGITRSTLYRRLEKITDWS